MNSKEKAMNKDELKEALKFANIIKSNGHIHWMAARRLTTTNTDLLTLILEYTKFIPEDRPYMIREKLQAIMNDVTEILHCPFCSKLVSWNRSFKTYSETCGDRTCASNLIQQRSKLTNLERYGHEYATSNKKVQAKRRRTMLDKYGPQYAEPQRKGRATCKELYGDEFFNRKHLSKETLSLLNNKEWLQYKHHIEHMMLKEIAKELDVCKTLVVNAFQKLNIPVLNFYVSKGEKELIDFLEGYQIHVVSRDRTVIHPNELDIYLPDFNVAIEYNGVYWHSEVYRDEEYHKSKHDRCKEQGVRLLTIFEDEWEQNRDIVEQTILNILKVSGNYTYAECDVRPVSNKEKSKYFKQNSILGDSSSSLSIGLYTDTLIACMSLNRLANEAYKIERYTEVIRTPSTLAKMIAYVETNHNPSKILVDVDLRWEDDLELEQCGFRFEESLAPDYTYVVKKQRYDKRKVTSKKVKSILKDRYDDTLTESDNMIRNGILKLYDCGSARLVKYGN